MKLRTVAFVLLLTKTCTWHRVGGGGGRVVAPKIAFFATVFSLKIGLLVGEYFGKQTNS